MRFFSLWLLMFWLPLSLRAVPLNDTGIDFCRNLDTAGEDTPVTPTASCAAAQGGQDGRYGRDAAASKAALPKVGAGGKGFDFTKIAHNGTTLTAQANLGSTPTDWACTYDNNTGLMWEVKTNSGLRDQAHTYSWYDSVHNYHGTPGLPNGGICQAAGRCDTEKFIADVNLAGLCGHNNWRMPTLMELFNLADRGQTSIAIDPAYFPNTPGEDFWSSSPSPICGGDICVGSVTGYGAWQVSFFWGGASSEGFRSNGKKVRLVRSGQ